MWSHLPIAEMTYRWHWIGAGPISAAVTRAINEDAGQYWYVGVRRGCAHGTHVDFAQCIDKFDALIFRRLARGLPSILAGMTMVEREDGSMRPMLISDPAWYEDRRKGVRKGEQFRRVHSVPVVEGAE